VKKLILIPLILLSTSACADKLATSLGHLPAPVDVADKIVLDEKAGIAVETMYTALVKAGSLAYRSGLIQKSTNPIVFQDNFCALVLANQFTVTDRGSQVNALECRIRDARDKTRAAYDALNATGYDIAAKSAVALGKEFLALLGN
jgi:hypothetical protein